MLSFIKRQWLWFQVWVGWRPAPKPSELLTPQLIAKLALRQLDNQLIASGLLPPTVRPPLKLDSKQTPE